METGGDDFAPGGFCCGNVRWVWRWWAWEFEEGGAISTPARNINNHISHTRKGKGEKMIRTFSRVRTSVILNCVLMDALDADRSAHRVNLGFRQRGMVADVCTIRCDLWKRAGVVPFLSYCSFLENLGVL